MDKKSAKRECPKCSGHMMEDYIEGKFNGIRNDGVCDGVSTIKYMCTECGYIEEYATNPKFYKK